MSVIGNFLWFITGGVFMGLSWWFVGVLAYVSVVGIPWGKACFVLGQFAFFPFGKEAINRKELTLQGDTGTGAAGMVGNVVWFLLAGVWLAIGHVISAVFCFITIIGTPFGLQHLKLAGAALAPIGKTIVTKEVAAAARRYNAVATLEARRGIPIVGAGALQVTRPAACPACGAVVGNARFCGACGASVVINR